MAFKFLEKKAVLSESEEFCIKEASWNEARELHNIFRKTISLVGPWKESPGKKLTLVAIDNKTKNVIGGLESTVDMKLASADLASFAVLPEFQKTTARVGTKLFETMIDELRKKGIKQVTATPTTKSWKIFKKHGLDYPPALKDEIRQRLLDENGCVEGAKMMATIRHIPVSSNSSAGITVDTEKMVDIRVKAGDTWKFKDEPPKEAETNAGVVKLRVAERPLMTTIKHLIWKKTQPDWERKEKEYGVFLTEAGSQREEQTGYVTLLYKRVRHIQAPEVRGVFISRGLKEEDKIVMIDNFYAVDPEKLKQKGTGSPVRGEIYSGDPEKLKRKRIGRAVLSQVLEDCKSEGIAAAYCCTTKPAMQALLGEFGFQNVGYFYLKML